MSNTNLFRDDFDEEFDCSEDTEKTLQNVKVRSYTVNERLGFRNKEPAPNTYSSVPMEMNDIYPANTDPDPVDKSSFSQKENHVTP